MAEKVPRLMAGVDIRKFKLDPMDGFLMTRIDGRLTPKDLARETGLPDFSVTRALEKLEKLGVIEIIDPSAPPPAPPPAQQPATKSTIARFDGGLTAPKYDPKELEEPADLPPEQKKRVLDFYYRLDDLDHYTLLGVTRESDKKAIKRAYFELAATFHPDRYFKKDLGSFKPKMEVLFNYITEAHDTLVDPNKRAEYNAYLAEVDTTRGMEAMLERAMAESAHAAAEAARIAQQQLPQQPPLAPVITVPPEPPPPAAPVGPSPEEIQRRREALARRLTGGQKAPSAPKQPSTPPNPHRYASSADAVDALKRRYEERVENATQAHAQRYIQAADDALVKNDYVAASTALSIAVKFAPDDGALAARAEEVRVKADALLCDSYLKQAQYEERQGHWEEASRSWLKVAKINNTASAHERAANALFRLPDSDLRVAAEHAKAAIHLEPGNIANHMTLIEIYVKAGLTTSARKAGEVATQLDPKHAGLQALLKRIGKG